MSADVESEVSAVLSKDMENIAAKVAAGKTLTSSEREFFMRQQPEVKDDNRVHPHSRLGFQSPEDYARRAAYPGLLCAGATPPL